MKIAHTATALARKYQRRAEALRLAVRRGLRRAAAAVDREQVARLRGGRSAPGSYPVPVRTGHLLGSHVFFVESDRSAIVGNTADYAINIHEGRGSSSAHGRRPFLDDAVAAVDITGEMAIELQREVLA